MMPDLGQYAVEVLSAYAASIALLLVIVIASVWKARRVLRKLSAVEERRGRGS
jgi:heme exporter protein D